MYVACGVQASGDESVVPQDQGEGATTVATGESRVFGHGHEASKCLAPFPRVPGKKLQQSLFCQQAAGTPPEVGLVAAPGVLEPLLVVVPEGSLVHTPGNDEQEMLRVQERDFVAVSQYTAL